MIRKLQIKFISIAMFAIILVTCTIYGVIGFSNYMDLDRRAETILNLIVENDGEIPEYTPYQGYEGVITRETKFSTRYFYAKVDSEGEIIEENVQYIASVSQNEAQEIVSSILNSSKTYGYYGDYRYKVSDSDNDQKIIVVLDYSFQMNSLRHSVQNAIWIILAGITLVFVILVITSKRVLAPMIENIEKQKQFVSNAGHELKTPIAVIMANADVMEMTEDNQDKIELIKSVKNQAQRLNELTVTLLNLARAEEGRIDNEFKEFSVTEMIKDEINEFKALAKNKTITFEFKEDIVIKADKTNIKELIIIFLDNAIKYSNEEGKIILKAEKQGKSVKLQFMNTCENPKSINVSKLFDRFYREDKSRNKKKSGYGIGLSMAKSIVDIHKGKIYAEITKDDMICFNVIL